MTGRLTGELGARSRRLIYGELSAADLAAELPWQHRVDRAHVVMLAERGLISPSAAGELLDCLAGLAADGYAALAGRPAPRGLYLMYEGWLIERLGPDVGGVLHTGRSRNDVKATVTALRLRDWVYSFAGEATRLLAVLLSRARAHRAVVLPVYTHFQAALPVTYGYYLLGVAVALDRELTALREAAAGLRYCPLGAGAAAGTDLPIDAARTAWLLGFHAPAPHALDAVASRDAALRLLAVATGIAVLLSRLATDLQLWSTGEFALVGFPDRLVGGSSAMPQKRNAFLLEHVKAKPAQAAGAFAAAAAAMSGTAFSNSIEVGTEAVAAVWPGLLAAEHAVLLCQVLVGGARPDPVRGAGRAGDTFTGATFVANQLVRAGVPFRTAHREVGDAVRRAVAAGATRLTGYLPAEHAAVASAGDDPAQVVAAHRFGGGPGDFDRPFDQAVRGWREHRDWLAGARRALAERAAELAGAADRISARRPA